MKPLSRKTKTAITTNICRLLLIITCVLVLFPLAWVVSSSFSKGVSLFSSSIFPKIFTLDNYIKLFNKTDFLYWIKNSAIACLGGSLLAVFFTVTMAYAFSRFKFKGKKNGLLALLLVQMLPSTATIVGIYQILHHMDLINKLPGLILIYGGLTIPFNAWLMRGYFNSIPKDLDESAYIDGASSWQAFTRITLPLAIPMVVVIFIFNLVTFYNEYIFVSIVMSGSKHYTVALGMRFFTQAYASNWSMFSATAVLACIPILLIFYFLQKYLVQGLTQGAIKG